MQFILSEEEYEALLEKGSQKDFIRLNNKALQELCTQIADTMPIKWSWGEDKPKPWGCIHSAKDYEWYCDDCPVQNICPSNKQYSQ